MKRYLFILAVLALFFATALLLYPQSSGPWTGYVATSSGEFVADTSHRTLDDCKQYIQSHSGGLCGFECSAGRNCKQLFGVPELDSRQ